MTEFLKEAPALINSLKASTEAINVLMRTQTYGHADEKICRSFWYELFNYLYVDVEGSNKNNSTERIVPDAHIRKAEEAAFTCVWQNYFKLRYDSGEFCALPFIGQPNGKVYPVNKENRDVILKKVAEEGVLKECRDKVRIDEAERLLKRSQQIIREMIHSAKTVIRIIDTPTSCPYEAILVNKFWTMFILVDPIEGIHNILQAERRNDYATVELNLARNKELVLQAIEYASRYAWEHYLIREYGYTPEEVNLAIRPNEIYLVSEPNEPLPAFSEKNCKKLLKKIAKKKEKKGQKNADDGLVGVAYCEER